MPLKHYGLLKARPIGMRQGTGGKPHYQIHVVDEKDSWRIAINVRSQDGSVGEDNPLGLPEGSREARHCARGPAEWEGTCRPLCQLLRDRWQAGP